MKTMNMETKKGKNRPLLVCSISLIFFLAIASVATAASVVSVQPPTQDAAPGNTFSINVNVDSGSDNLQSAHVELNFDTSKLVANTLTPGTLLGTGTSILEEPGNGIGTGKITYGVARTAGNSAKPENGTLFTVQFTVKSSAPAGVSALDLANVELMKSVSSPIASPTVNDGQVKVTGSSQTTVTSSRTSTPSTNATLKPTGTPQKPRNTSQAAGENKTNSTPAPTDKGNKNNTPVAAGTTSAQRTPGISAIMALATVLVCNIICKVRKKNR